MDLLEKIKQIYPDIEDTAFGHFSYITFQDDGAGQYIAKWEHPTLARPTQEQLDAVGGA